MSEVRRLGGQRPDWLGPDAVFRPSFPWLGGDLQTLRNLLRPPSLPAVAEDAMWFTAADGESKLSGRLRAGDTARPLAVIIHGLTGDMDGVTVRAAAHHLGGQGYPVLRLNLRGAGETQPFARSLYHTGLTADLSALLEQLPERLTRNGVVLYGFSLSANQVLRFAGEGRGEGMLKAVIAVCAPIDPLAAVRALERPRNRIYERHLVRGMQAGALGSRLDARFHPAVRRARGLFEYDDRVTAPVNGFADAHDFYAKAGAMPVLESIKTPALVLHAADDPWIPAAAYEAARWPESAICLISPGGGHCGFHDGEPAAWHNRAASRFLAQLG